MRARIWIPTWVRGHRFSSLCWFPYSYCAHLCTCIDESLRPNAILLQGTPISNLPTSNIFAYVGHYDVKPIGLEWVDDTTCVLVFETRRAAVASYACLLKSDEENSDVFGLSAAQPVPPGILPPKPKSGDDVAVTSESDLFGGIRMRWARKEDVKQKGAKGQSKFYQRHGEMAGKDGRGFFDDPPSKRKRRETDEEARARLDQELELMWLTLTRDTKRSHDACGYVRNVQHWRKQRDACGGAYGFVCWRCQAES